MTVAHDEFDTLRRLVEQLAQAQVQSKSQHDQEMLELRQLQASNARAIEANSAGIAENSVAIAALTQQVSELSNGVDAAFRTIESMHRVAESLEINQIEMRQNHEAQMERLGQTLDLLMTRYPPQQQQ